MKPISLKDAVIVNSNDTQNNQNGYISDYFSNGHKLYTDDEGNWMGSGKVSVKGNKVYIAGMDNEKDLFLNSAYGVKAANAIKDFFNTKDMSTITDDDIKNLNEGIQDQRNHFNDAYYASKAYAKRHDVDEDAKNFFSLYQYAEAQEDTDENRNLMKTLDDAFGDEYKWKEKSTQEKANTIKDYLNGNPREEEATTALDAMFTNSLYQANPGGNWRHYLAVNNDSLDALNQVAKDVTDVTNYKLYNDKLNLATERYNYENSLGEFAPAPINYGTISIC